MYQHVIKPIFDFLGSLILLITASPLFLISTLFLAIANRGRIFFVQPRPGKEEKIFRLIKFRTMNDARDARGDLLPDADRLTWAGRLVRATSVDELPQLFNVLKGDMSLIGPRPWLVEYLPLYNAYQRRRHEVKPGITGWAQVHGRNAVNWEQRFKYDVYYVDHLSFLLDFKILLRTIWKILKMEGISGEGSVTMEKFVGTGSEAGET
jgi:lipopolysaccharide/colanic/teichoic acid biosynthesis glycosyltransferase